MKNETAPSGVSSNEETTLPTATTTVLSTLESEATRNSVPSTSETTTVSSVTEDEKEVDNEEDDLSPTLTVTFEPVESSTQTSVTTEDSTILSTLFPNIKVGRIMNESLIAASTDVTDGDLDTPDTFPTSNTETNFNILELLNSTINTDILANVLDIETSTASVEYNGNNEVPSFEVTIDFSDSNNNDVAEEQTTSLMSQVELQTKVCEDFTVTKKVPTGTNMCL